MGLLDWFRKKPAETPEAVDVPTVVVATASAAPATKRAAMVVRAPASFGIRAEALLEARIDGHAKGAGNILGYEHRDCPEALRADLKLRSREARAILELIRALAVE